jgi:N-acetylmuramoyl-L-alanine amidase
MKIKNIIVVTIFLLLFAASCFTENNTEYSETKKNFQKLKNTDIYFKKPKDWNFNIDKLKIFSEKLPYEQAAESIFLIAQAYNILWKNNRSEEFFDLANKYYEEVIDRFPNSSKSPWSLKELYLINFKKDKDLAKEYLEKIISDYPDSEYFEFATTTINNKLEDNKINVPKSNTNYTVVIDPGHGGEDFGAVGVGGIYEKDVVLEIAYKIKDKLEEQNIAKAILTRDSDTFIPLQKRTEIANKNLANLFISLHCNASETKKLSGFEIYTLDTSGDKAANLLAQRENASFDEHGHESEELDDVSLIVGDVIRANKKKESLQLAFELTNGIKKSLIDSEFEKIVLKKPKSALFYVLVGANMPAALVEFAYIDNQQEGLLLSTPKFREQLSDGVVEGIKKFKSSYVKSN